MVERTAELLSHLRYCDAASVAVVGHSHYFRELFRNFMDPAAVADAAANPSGEALLHKKLANCGVAAVELDWSRPEGKPIAAVRLLFGTELVD